MYDFAQMQTTGIGTRPQTEGLGALVKVGTHFAFLGSKAENDQIKRKALLAQKIPLRPLPVEVPKWGLGQFDFFESMIESGPEETVKEATKEWFATGSDATPTDTTKEDPGLLSKVWGGVQNALLWAIPGVGPIKTTYDSLPNSWASRATEALTPGFVKDATKQATETLKQGQETLKDIQQKAEKTMNAVAFLLVAVFVIFLWSKS